ncbi:MAG: lysoplasmalogenase family protein [Bacilli bacterium]
MSHFAIGIMIGESIIMLFYLLFYYRWGSKTILLLKISTSFGFVLLGIINLQQANNLLFGTTVLLGLICGWLGDLALGLRNIYRSQKKEFFYAGLLLFFIGHIIYIIAFYQFRSGSLFIPIIISLVLLSIIYTISVKAKVDYKQAKIPVVAYMAISSFLLTFVLFNMLNDYAVVKLIIFLGALSFVTSDFLLNFLYFKKIERPKIRLLKAFNIVTYYLGQTLFAISIIFM